MPGLTFAFLPADSVSQILNFGLPAPINVQVVGLNLDHNRKYAATLLNRFRHIPGIVDTRIQQAFNYPQLNVTSDRTLAQELGITQLNIASNMLITLSGSFQTTPNFWVDPKNGVSYPVVTQVPQYDMDSLLLRLTTIFQKVRVLLHVDKCKHRQIHLMAYMQVWFLQSF